MTEFEQQDGDTPLGEASAWVARLQGEGLTETDGLAFDAWLDRSAENRVAYAAAVTTWHEFEAAAPELLLALDAARRAPGRTLGRGWLAVGGAIAAAAALAVVVLPQTIQSPRAERYATARGQHLAVKLADGSTIDLNAQTRLAVTLARHGRRVVMGDGEAIFDVAADARRPFEIEAGGRVVRVVGTQFDVRNRADGLAVIVARGVVQVRGGPDGAAQTFVLHPGQRLDLNTSGATRVSATNPADSFGWRSGRLVYRDEPLANVVADLNRQFREPIRIEDPKLAQSRISGVLILDNQADVLQRLALMLPIKAVRSDGDVLLQPR